jgi:hypothetical protein
MGLKKVVLEKQAFGSHCVQLTAQFPVGAMLEINQW